MQSPFGDPQMDEFFSRFFGGQLQRERVRQSLGSGFIISPTATCCQQPCGGQGRDIKVTLADGKTLDAKLVGRSPEIDIALLKVEATGLPSVTFGDSDLLEVATGHGHRNPSACRTP